MIGIGRFASQVPDLGSNKKHFARFRAVIPTLLDTGVIVALLDRSGAYHVRCVTALEGLEGPLVTCEAVITESCYLLRDLSGAAATVLENVKRGIFRIPFQFSRAAAIVRAVMRKYRDLPADFADACLIELADELNTGDIVTLTEILSPIAGAEPAPSACGGPGLIRVVREWASFRSLPQRLPRGSDSGSRGQSFNAWHLRMR